MPSKKNARLERARRSLPVVDSLPPAKDRSFLVGDVPRRPSPTLAVWAFTQACDQHCMACGPRSGKTLRNELSTDESLRLVDELAEMGVGEVVLIGGEAYLRPDFLLVIRAIRERGMRATMTTGGYGFTPQHIEAAAEAGLQLVSFSIDGLASTHDALRRREGSWARAFEGIAHVRRAGMAAAANTQINRRTMGQIAELADLLGDAGIVSWQMFLTIPHGGAADHPDLILQPYMMLEVFEEIERMLERCRAHGIKVWPGKDREFHQRVYDVAGAADNGSAVDPQTCATSAGRGARSFCQTWRDPDYDSGQEAAYYLRVIENPSCRWSWQHCLSVPEAQRPGSCVDPELPRFIQERAWSSPIWVEPV